MPKVARPEDVPAIALPVHCLIESAAGLEAAYAIASAPGVAGISLGEADLRSETGALEAGLDWARGRIVNAAVAAGLPRPPQSVYPHLRDDEGLARSCARGRELGHLGRAAIHPAQLPIIEQAYLPTEDELERARATVERLEAAGAGTLDGGRVRRRRDARRGAADRGAGRFVRHLNTSNTREELMKNRLTPAAHMHWRAAQPLLLIMLAPSAVGSSSAVAEGSLTSGSFHSATLGEAINYNVYLPAGYEGSTNRYPVLYLLHGRGDSMSAWTRMQGTLDELIATGEIPPTIAIMPDAPWSSRASYYVDSAYTRRRSRPHGRDGVHAGSDRARRLDVPDRRHPQRSRRRRLLDGRLRRDPVLARAPRSVRRGDRAQPGGVRPDPAERLQHARVRRLRQGQAPVRRARSTSS